MPIHRSHMLLFISFWIVLFISGIQPKDLFTWWLEVLPAIILVLILAATYHLFRFTTFTYVWIWLHMLILLIGGHYTYAEVPLFNWLRDTFHLERNYYDRVGHFAQGFVPALLTREVLIRVVEIQKRGWLSILVIAVCLAFSALYELLEFLVAKLTGTAANAFLGTQGDSWDTQWDMTFALIGAILALLLFRNVQDRKME
ncbi:Inner membrane protein YjdF [Bacillus rhizoplanae]|uniref:Inner membrane protein YjdF n=2 Tax=Bacillaceae TaxID=186817 RepID=A0ABN8A1N4_9BACI|nr:Inner membrane protein YjdF [Bacillus rhizoplanae]